MFKRVKSIGNAEIQYDTVSEQCFLDVTPSNCMDAMGFLDDRIQHMTFTNIQDGYALGTISQTEYDLYSAVYDTNPRKIERYPKLSSRVVIVMSEIGHPEALVY